MQTVRYLPLPERQETAERALSFLTVLFRQRRLAVFSFLSILLGAMLAAILVPIPYQAEVKILVRRERQDPLVSSGPNNETRVAGGLTEQEINAEVDLLQSNDLLQQVVIASGLADAPDSWLASQWTALRSRLPFASTPEQAHQERIARQVQKLQAQDLRVTPPNKSNLIGITYESQDAQMSADVLNTLARLYVEKHLAAHRSVGTLDIFQRQADEQKRELDRLQAQLLEFNRREGVVEPEQEKQATLGNLSQFEATQRDLQASIAETEQKIRSLQEQARSTPRRTTTQVRTRVDLVQELNTTLFTLQQKRSEMLTKYDPSYRQVQDLDKQIEDARAAIEEAKKAPIQEEVTDENPTYQWVDSEMARARSQLAALKARFGATTRNVQTYREQAQQLEKKSVAQQDLVRAAKAAEQNYMLYRQKQEEARATAALDQQRILNVAIAEKATVPALPEPTLWIRLLGGLFLACLVSLGLAFAKDYLDPAFRTPDEVRLCLNLPVLAAIPSPLLLTSGAGAAGGGPADRAER